MSDNDLISRLRHMAKLLGVSGVDIPALLNESADEIERLRGALKELAVGFEYARDRSTYAAEAQRLEKCAEFCRSRLA